MRTNATIILSDFINLVLGAVAFLLVARIVLKLFSANPSTPVVAFIYDLSGFLLLPMGGVFKQLTANTTNLDVSAIIALLIYGLIAYLASALIGTFDRPVERVHTNFHNHHFHNHQ